jgi:hypothetical protein
MIGLKSLNFLKVWEQRRRNQLRYLLTRERNKVGRIDIRIRTNGNNNIHSSCGVDNTSR